MNQIAIKHAGDREARSLTRHVFVGCLDIHTLDK